MVKGLLVFINEFTTLIMECQGQLGFYWFGIRGFMKKLTSLLDNFLLVFY